MIWTYGGERFSRFLLYRVSVLEDIAQDQSSALRNTEDEPAALPIDTPELEVAAMATTEMDSPAQGREEWCDANQQRSAQGRRSKTRHGRRAAQKPSLAE